MATPTTLPLPDSLRALIESGFWPLDYSQVLQQNLESLIATDKIKSFAPDEDRILFYPPPFHTVAHLQKSGQPFWDWPMAAVHEIDANLTLLLGDFGLGSDAPIALDYRRSMVNPSVIRLKHICDQIEWGKVTSTWVEIAPTFDAFVKMILD